MLWRWQNFNRRLSPSTITKWHMKGRSHFYYDNHDHHPKGAKTISNYLHKMSSPLTLHALYLMITRNDPPQSWLNFSSWFLRNHFITTLKRLIPLNQHFCTTVSRILLYFHVYHPVCCHWISIPMRLHSNCQIVEKMLSWLIHCFLFQKSSLSS